jgi:uroporphyrinogen decarboxylase
VGGGDRAERAVQGNLDPAALFRAASGTGAACAAGNGPGHIFNLAPGNLPETPVENVRAVVEMVHEYTVREAA